MAGSESSQDGSSARALLEKVCEVTRALMHSAHVLWGLRTRSYVITVEDWPWPRQQQLGIPLRVRWWRWGSSILRSLHSPSCWHIDSTDPDHSPRDPHRRRSPCKLRGSLYRKLFRSCLQPIAQDRHVFMGSVLFMRL